MCCNFFERLQKHSTEIVFLGSPNKGSSSEGKILAYKKKQVDLISSMLMLRAYFPFSPFFVAVSGSRRLVKNAA